jgi:hypothetical protein
MMKFKPKKEQFRGALLDALKKCESDLRVSPKAVVFGDPAWLDYMRDDLNYQMCDKILGMDIEVTSIECDGIWLRTGIEDPRFIEVDFEYMVVREVIDLVKSGSIFSTPALSDQPQWWVTAGVKCDPDTKEKLNKLLRDTGVRRVRLYEETYIQPISDCDFVFFDGGASSRDGEDVVTRLYGRMGVTVDLKDFHVFHVKQERLRDERMKRFRHYTTLEEKQSNDES